MGAIEKRGASALIHVKLKPRASHNRVEGLSEGRLVVAVNVPPVHGEANRALIGLLSKAISRNKRSIEIIKGTSSRYKTLKIEDIEVEELENLLNIPTGRVD